MASRTVEFLNLQKINSKFEEEFQDSFSQFLKKGWYILGENVSAFEKEFAEFCGVQFCIGVNSGLDALVIPLMGYIEMGKLKEGDEVLVPANTYIATILAITQLKLKPVFVTPNFLTMNIDVSGLQRSLTGKSRVIMPVHLYGRICPMDEISQFAKDNNLIVLEDSAQAHGAELSGKKAGSWGDASGFSFYPGKNLGALGDGGAITTNDKDLAEVVAMIRNYGSRIRYVHELKGLNSRLDELQAAFLRIKLKSYKDEMKIRRELASIYYEGLKGSAIQILDQPVSDNEHVYHLFVVRTKERAELQKFLKSEGIETLIHYPTPAYNQKAYSELNYTNKELDNVTDEILSLPIGSHLEKDDIEYVCNTIAKFSEKK